LGRSRKKCGGDRGKSLEDLRIAEVVKLDMLIEKNKVVAYRARVNISFKYRAEA